jgi:hypothetical protein
LFLQGGIILSEKQDRQGVRTVTDLERKYNFGKTFAELLGIANDARDKVDSVESQLRSEIQEQYTKISRDTEKIIMEALTRYVETSDYEEFQKTVSSQFKIMADEISANLISTTERITSVDGDLSEFRKYCESEFKTTSEQVSLNMQSTTESFTLVNSAIEEAQGDIEEQSVFSEELKEYCESEFLATAEMFNIGFQSTTEQVTNLNGDIQKISESLEKHFEFGTNGLTIKAGEHEIKLRIDNDMIAFYNGEIDENDLDKNRFGWWDGVDFHTGNIVVKLNERAQIGNFAFIPRSNGSLDFMKVGG